ncbi:hypothetical protein WBU96_28390 [Bacillus albus]|uniref:Phage protein n=1 Tax=Bacillus cereus TIAC219 TaxID=718222 RepID=A0ABC9SQH1_BACCE|nr:hypothetical protein [Bacillus cereus]EJP81139.1 hypothetical protein IC1_06627 [Bacillus cereus VD022]EOQ57832.1 hypothetical protein IAY_06254 [Bacillus cereus TIAC219]
MKVQLIEAKRPMPPLGYGDMVEVTYKNPSIHEEKHGYYLVTYDDTLVNLDGGVRFKNKCHSLDTLLEAIRNDSNIESYRVLSKTEYTVQIHKKDGDAK